MADGPLGDEKSKEFQSTTMKKDLLIASLICCIAGIVLLAGFFAGRYSVLARFGKEIDVIEQAYTLGSLLKEKEKHRVVQVYHPDSRDLRSLDNYSWAPPNLPTPFVGSAPAPGVQANAHINTLQFRNARELVMPKPEGVVRVFLTGGSTAYGSGASSDERTVAGYLERELNDRLAQPTHSTFEVFTVANPAWASTHERIVTENLLSELQPDLVIALSGNNDVHWAEDGHNILWFRTYFDANVFSIISRVFHLGGGMELQDNLPPSRQPVKPETVAARLKKNVDLSVFALSRQRIPYLFALQPTLTAGSKPLTAREEDMLRKKSRKNPGHRDYFRSCYLAIDTVLSSAARGDFHYLNLAAVFDQNAGEEIFIDSYHFGDRGNELIARAIAAKLAEILSPKTQPDERV
jgi:lysophospholipase L1-like esterase